MSLPMTQSYCRKDQATLEAHSRRIANEVLADIDHYFQQGNRSNSSNSSSQPKK